MKSLILAIALAMTSFAFAGDKVEASKDAEYKFLELVVGVKHTYSQTSGLDAKVVEVLGGDGGNPIRMILVLNTGYQDSKVFVLNEMLSQVTRITFLAKDLIVINYTQDSYDDSDNPVEIKKSIKIKVLRNADNTLAENIEIVD